MALPFWRPKAENNDPAYGPPNITRENVSFGPPPVVQSASQAAAAWDAPLINNRKLPGLVRLTKAPTIALQEVFSEAEGKDAQVRKVLGLKAAEWTYECTLLTEEHWRDWLAQRNDLLPVEKANGRAEVKSIAHPPVNAQGISFGYVFSLEFSKTPQAGGPAVFEVHFRHWWPADTAKRQGKAGKKTKDPVRTQNEPVGTVDIASSVPKPPSLLPPTPSRLR